MAGSREPPIDQTLSQPVCGCTEGLSRLGQARPLAEGDVALVLAETGGVLGESRGGGDRS
jgi:hypothetical protein